MGPAGLVWLSAAYWAIFIFFTFHRPLLIIEGVTDASWVLRKRDIFLISLLSFFVFRLGSVLAEGGAVGENPEGA